MRRCNDSGGLSGRHPAIPRWWTMNKKQRFVLVAGLVAFVLMGLFPPWLDISQRRWVIHSPTPTYSQTPPSDAPQPQLVPPSQSVAQIEYAGGYAFLFSPGSHVWGDGFNTDAHRVDFPRLAIQWITTAALVCGLLLLLKDPAP
jgi:hypothetical protein